MAQPIVVVLGGINMDLVATVHRFPALGETVVGSSFTTYPGGKGANQAVGAARMGAAVRMIGRVGGDGFGQQLRQGLGQEGIDVSGIAVDSSSTSGIAVIHIDASAQNQIVQVKGANENCGVQELEQVVRALVGASVLMLQLEVPVDVSLRAAEAAVSRGCRVILDPAPAGELPAGMYRQCDYITPNESESEALVGFPVTDVDSARRAAEVLIGRGAGCAVIKMGAGGAFYLTGRRSAHVPAFAVEAVETVAAGDAFNGALAVALAEGRDMAEAIRWASAAGALAVTRAGAQDAMPWRSDVKALLAG